MIAGTLSLGCGLTSAGPEVARIESINVTPGRLALVPFQSADLTVDVITSRDSAAAGSLQWSTTGGLITNNFVAGGVRHVTYQSPAQPGNYFFIVTTTTGFPADSARIAVTSTPVPVNAVTLTPGNVSLVVGDTTTLRAMLTDSTGSALFGRAIDWSTSDPAVATVLATGLVRAIAVGTVTVTATAGGHSGTSVVTVN